MIKPILLFLPGMLCDHRLYAEAEECEGLKKYDFHYGVYAGNSIAEMGANLLQQIKAENFFAVGLSMGGIVLMEMLCQAPHRVAAAVLADTNHRSELPERKALRAVEIDKVKKNGLGEFVVEEMKPKYFSPQLILEEKKKIQARVLKMATDFGFEKFALQSIALRDRCDYGDTLASFGKTAGEKLLLICGEDDMLCSAEKHRQMHELTPGSRLAVIKKAGHLSCMENPIDFYAEVVAFFDSF